MSEFFLAGDERHDHGPNDYWEGRSPQSDEWRSKEGMQKLREMAPWHREIILLVQEDMGHMDLREAVDKDT